MSNIEITYKLTTPEGEGKATTCLIEDAGSTAAAEIIFAKRMQGMSYRVTLVKVSRIAEIFYAGEESENEQ